MRKIVSIMMKDFKLILRSRTSALIILFGPLLIMLIVGIAFNNASQLRINVGHYAHEKNELTASFVEKLSNYNVQEYYSEEECRQSILSGTTHICVIFPHDLSIGNNRVNEIVFMVDNSKINFFQTVVESIGQDFNKLALELTTGMTQELLDKLNDTQESISNKSAVIAQLKEDNRVLRQDAQRISSEVSSLDLTFRVDSLNIRRLETSTGDVQKALDNVKKIATDAIEDSLDMIDEMDEEVRALNISGLKKNELLTILNETATDLMRLKNNLNKSQQVNTSGLSGMITDLKGNLAEVEDRFQAAASARDVTVDKISSMNSKLNASHARVLAVEETFNAIYANIGSTEVTDIGAITNPITKRLDPVAADENQLNFFFPYLVVLIVMFIGLLLSSTLIIMEKTSQAHFRNFVTPTKDVTFVFGAYATTLIIMALQLTIILLLYSLYFNRGVFGSMKETVIIIFLLTTFFSFLGMAIGNLFNTEETGTLAAVSVGSIFLFVSDLIFPLEKMPVAVATISANYNPFVIGSELLRKALVLGRPLSELGMGIYLIVAYTALVFGIMMLLHKVTKRTFLLRWGGYVARRELRKQKREEVERELLDIYDNLPEPEQFETHEQARKATLKDLADYVEDMHADHLKEYYLKGGNKLADWAESSLKNAELAAKLRKAKGKKAIVKVLQSAEQEYGRLRERYKEKTA